MTGLPGLQASTQRRVVNAEFSAEATKPTIDPHEAKGAWLVGTAPDQGSPESVGAGLAKPAQGSGSPRLGHQTGYMGPGIGAQQVARIEPPAQVKQALHALVGVGLVSPDGEIAVHTQ